MKRKTKQSTMFIAKMLPLVCLCLGWNHNVLVSGESKKPPTPQHVQAFPYSRDSVMLKWNITKEAAEISSSFKIEYGFYERTNIKLILTNDDVRSFIIGNLQFHTIYRMRVALEQGGSTSRFSDWIIVRLDVETFVVEVQLPSETRQKFQEALYEILPLSYLSSKELKAKNIDLDTSLMEVFYEIYFPIGVNFTATHLYNMFARNHARAHTSFVRNINVSDISFCTKGRNECSKFAKCIQTPGSYRCECLEFYYDYGIGSHLFNGRNCTSNSEKPSNLALRILNSTAIRLEFQAPKTSLGPISFYEVEFSSLSSDDNKVQTVVIEKIGILMKHNIANLKPQGLYQFRARAVTKVTPGRWSGWAQIRMILSLFKVVFQLKPKEEIPNFQAIQKVTNRRIRNQVKRAFKGSTTLSMVDFAIARSDIHGNGNIRFIGHLYVTHKRHLDIGRLQKAARAKLKSKLRTKIGVVWEKSVRVQDFDECGTKFEDCSGNRCVNKVGYFICQCPTGQVDISTDLHLLPGRKCIVFDAPLAFSVSLMNPQTALLNWKIPPQLRKPQHQFWFIVEYKIKSAKVVQGEKVDLNDEDFSKETYVVFTRIRNLNMNTVYDFRVAVANKNNNGRFTAWKTLETSNLIFTVKLNLTLLVFSRALRNRNHDFTVESADNVRTLLDLLLVKMPEYMATGRVNFRPGIQDRTFAFAHIFFNSKSNVNVKHIQDMFKHNSFHDDVLGLDFDAVEVSDFDECKSTWDDCSKNATCINEVPGFKCKCQADHVDLSNTVHQAPGRYCLHKDLHTTPEPTTTPETTTVEVTTTPMSFPNVQISGVAISPNKIRIKWYRSDSQGSSNNQLNYDIQYRIKGSLEWSKTTVAAFTKSLNIGGLRRGFVYEVRIAERWKGETDVHTLYSFPREIRTEIRAYRIYLHLPDIPPVATVLSAIDSPDKQKLTNLVSQYINDVFSHPNVANSYSRFLFGSIGDVSFSRHPDRGVMVSAIVYLTKSSSATETAVKFAYTLGEKNVPKQRNMDFIAVSDLDECSSSTNHDCSTSAICKNVPAGTFTCECFDGFVDSSKPYFLLPGRYCVLPDTPLTPATTSTVKPLTLPLNIGLVKSSTNVFNTTTTNYIGPVESATTPEFTSQTRSTSTKQPTEDLFVEPVNMIGLSSEDCPKGQRNVQSLCQNVLVFVGRINILKQSGNNLTASNLIGDGKSHVTEAVEEALDTAFNDMPETTDFLKSRVQQLRTDNNKIRALFVIVLTSFGEGRSRRQINFASQKVDSFSIKQGLYQYLFEKFPTGKVVPDAGASITFDIKEIIISNINECTWRLGALTSSRRLHDCDVNKGLCIDTAGSFTCKCKPGTTDVHPNAAEHPGRSCADQCNPSPCLNGGSCIASQHNGSPSCECTKDFSGHLCGDAENNLVVILSTVAGVVGLFVSCFGVTFCIHRRNKRKEKLKKTAMTENHVHLRGSDTSFSSDEFSESGDSENEDKETKVPVPLPRGAASLSPGRVNPAFNNDVPPPTPVRTLSVVGGNIHKNYDFNPKSDKEDIFDPPPIPRRDPVPSSAPLPIYRTNPSSTFAQPEFPNRITPAKSNMSSIDKPLSNRNISALSNFSNANKKQSNNRNTSLQSGTKSSSKSNVKHKKQKKSKATKAIRGKIRKHSDESGDD